MLKLRSIWWDGGAWGARSGLEPMMMFRLLDTQGVSRENDLDTTFFLSLLQAILNHGQSSLWRFSYALDILTVVDILQTGSSV